MKMILRSRYLSDDVIISEKGILMHDFKTSDDAEPIRKLLAIATFGAIELAVEIHLKEVSSNNKEIVYDIGSLFIVDDQIRQTIWRGETHDRLDVWNSESHTMWIRSLRFNRDVFVHCTRNM